MNGHVNCTETSYLLTISIKQPEYAIELSIIFFLFSPCPSLSLLFLPAFPSLILSLSLYITLSFSLSLSMAFLDLFPPQHTAQWEITLMRLRCQLMSYMHFAAFAFL